MPFATSPFIERAKRSALPISLSFGAVLAVGLFAAHSGVHASTLTASPLDEQSVAALSSLDGAMETLAARVTPAVVNIAVTSRGSEEAVSERQRGGAQDTPPGTEGSFGQDEDGMQAPQQQQLQHGIGSGVIVSPDGYIVTNNHVVDGATEIEVTLHDRRVLPGKVVGVDKLTDLAVIKVNATELPSVSWGDSSKLEPGQTVLAFGSPFGYFQFSVTRGIVSAINRPNPYSDDARKPGGYIQTDAAINPGNSGGPLVNAHGELVGINTFIISNSGSFAGAGFAIPSQLARATTEQLIRHGKVDHGYLGISLNDVTPDNAHLFNLQENSGAIVAQISPDSPASRAGLQQGDVIKQLNGRQVTNGSALQVAMSAETPGTKITLGVLRNGKPMALDITVGRFEAAKEVAQADEEDGDTQSGS